MKTATIPAVRVAPSLREAVESLLEDGQTLSSYTEQALREKVARDLDRAAFAAQGQGAWEQFRRDGIGVSMEQVVDGIDRRIEARRKKLLKGGR